MSEEPARYDTGRASAPAGTDPLREALEFCARVLFQLDQNDCINSWTPDEDEERRAEHLADLAREAIAQARAALALTEGSRGYD